MRGYLASRIPALNGSIVKAETCMYTMTPDGHFVIGTHPDHPPVTIAAGFSGHGFKFASVVGEILGGRSDNWYYTAQYRTLLSGAVQTRRRMTS